MSEIDRCLAEQRIGRDWLAQNGHAHPEAKMARMGVADWVAEEIMVRMENQYQDFLKAKQVRFKPCGFEITPEQINSILFPFQRDVVKWSVRRGRAALFEDCGLGKTFQQIEWGRLVCEKEGGSILIFAPLAVSFQTQEEARKLGVNVTICESSEDIRPGLNITNYEKLHRFKPAGITGLILDESSILKGFDGKTRRDITEFAEEIPYRLCCTATPAPNDYMELGNHAEFLGVMTATEMLSMFFVHDGGETSKWRLKKHAEDEFWRWVCSWAVAIRQPSDLGYDDGKFRLPELLMEQVAVEGHWNADGVLFQVEAQTLNERRDARRSSLGERVAACADLVNSIDEPWIVWCDLNAESEALADAIPGAVEVRGSDDSARKEHSLMEFTHGHTRVLVTKPTIAGFGMNWQHCRRVAFVGLSDSYEQFYQAIRRCWRFGQTSNVHCYVITSKSEGAVVRNIERKEELARKMMDGMVLHMQTEMQREVRGLSRETAEYERDAREGDAWTAHLGDSVEVLQEIEPGSIDYMIFSPPFASLYTYSNSERDMGNSKSGEEFSVHFAYLIKILFKALRPGRLVSFHCMNLPSTKERDGFIGLKDFRGELIKMFQDAGFIYHSEVVIWKDPVTAMQRTKAIGLLYKQLKKDSALSRQGIPDYLVTMRKPGFNDKPITKDPSEFPVGLWQQYASPVWMDINPSETLSRQEARSEDDERHICPLQLEVIRRAIRLWTVPGDLVLSPFMGIGSEGHESLMAGRRFVGCELKRSYWEQACKNLEFAEKHAGAQGGLFDVEATEETE